VKSSWFVSRQTSEYKLGVLVTWVRNVIEVEMRDWYERGSYWEDAVGGGELFASRKHYFR
jgi:hypothetical protein